MDVLKKVKKTILDNNLITSGDSILVALSGGPDSVALLHLLHRLKKEMHLKLYAVYINHNIRKRAAKKEEQFCQILCDRLKVKLFIEFEDVPLMSQQSKKGLEETARNIRYAVFQRLCHQFNIQKTALGHHIDDRVETVLFRIVRGTGRTGLRGIPVKRDKIIRPLYDLTKNEILDYLKKQKLTYCIDQSNYKKDFKRNYIRNKLLVEIRKNLNPAVENALINLSETASEEEVFLDKLVQKHFKKNVTRTAGGKIELALNKFKSYDKWLRRRLLRHCLAELSNSGLALDRLAVDRLEQLCINAGKAVSLPEGIQAVLFEKKLVIFRRINRRFTQKFQLGKSCQLTQPALTFKATVINCCDRKLDKQKRKRIALLDYGKITFPLVIRSIKPGDKFKPLGLNGTKKIGDYLTDRKIDKIYRDEIPVLCDKEGIIWLVGFEIADRVKIVDSTKEVLKIEVTQRAQSRVTTV